MISGEEVCGALLAAARKAGAEAADAVAIEGDSLSVDARGGKLEQAERSEGAEFGLRVLIGRRQACVSASDARRETFAIMAERAVAMAREAPEDKWCGLSDPGEIARDWDAAALMLEDDGPAPAAAELETMALEAEAAALAVKGVSQVESAGASWGRSRIHLAATNGFSGGYGRTSHALYVSAIAGEGLKMERDYRAESRRRGGDLPPAEEIGKTAGERAVARLDPRRPRTGAFPVLFDQRVAASLTGHLLGAANGAAVARGASFLRDRMEKRVLPKGVDLIEEPHRPFGPASRPFDGEGIATRERAIVEDGVLKSWILDCATARKLGLATTGNASRGASAPPSPSVGNTRLVGEGASYGTLLTQMGTGLIVTSMIGSSINPTTGDYSRGASGFWVEGGEIAYPVNELTVAGNLLRMLESIQPCDDADPHDRALVPSLLVEGLTIAGG